MTRTTQAPAGPTGSRWSNFFASKLNRLVLTYGFGLLLAFAAIGGLSLAAYDNLVAHDTRQTVLAEHQGLRDIYRAEGKSGLRAAIENRVAEDVHREAVYALADRDGRMLAGHLEDAPPELLRKRGWTQFPWNDEGDTAIVYIERLPDDALLITGHTTGQQQHLRELIMPLGLSIFALLASLTMLLGWLLRRALDRALQTSLDAVDRFAAGHLRERIPTAGGDDAFARLSHTLNRMLDRIRDLIGGIQSSTDAIAHDLRTPLMRLKTRLEEAHLASADPISLQAIDDAIEETDRLMLTFNGLLRLANIEGAERTPTDEVALDEVVADAVEMWQAVAEASGRSIEAVIEPARIAGDRDLLFQMLSNLLDNAVKYSPPDGRIDVALRTSGDHVSLIVRDRGPGIPQEQRERVFDRFVRLEEHRGSPGTGLGLSLVRAIVSRHDAELHLSDAGPGAAFEVRFSKSVPPRLHEAQMNIR